MVWPYAGLKRAARGSLKIQDAKSRQKSPSGHHRINLSSYIFAAEAHIDNRNKSVEQQYLLHVHSQYGELRQLAAEMGPVVLGTPANFNGFASWHRYRMAL